ncbi:HNH endonuclease [Tamlana crocina]
MKKTKTNIPQKNKVRSELQKEIDSICPFCDNEDVGHFEIHHIDENPSNHNLQNLILLCPTCHSKITKEDISMQEVIDIKLNLKNKKSKIQFVSVSIDEHQCGWRPIKDYKNAFEAVELKSLFPVFNFTFINQSNKTVLLTSVKIRSEQLPIGLAGPHIPLPTILRPVIKYKIGMPFGGKVVETNLTEELEVPADRAFKFQIEIYSDSMERFNPPFNKYALFFEFGFNNDFYLKVPMILLNTKKYYKKLKIYRIG